MSDFIPERDNEFRDWLANLVRELAAQADSFPLTDQERAALAQASTVLDAALTENVRAQTAARAACQAKNQARKAAMQLSRAAAARIQTHPTVTDTQRRALRLPVRDRKPTPAAVPHSAPLAIVDASQRLRHSLRILDPANGNRCAKPAGVLGCEVWMYLEPPPSMVNGTSGEPRATSGEGAATITTDVETRGHGDAAKQQPVNSQQTLLGITTNGRFLHEFDGQHAGWTAYYRLRWFNRRGKKGPWSEFASATVSG